MLPDLPANISLSAGKLEIVASTAVAMLESLMTLAMVMRNDPDRFRDIIERPPSRPDVNDEELRELFDRRADEASGASD